jgi:hypothetical protein
MPSPQNNKIASDKEPKIQDDGGIPPGLTVVAIVVGLVLVLAGAAMMVLFARLFNAGSLAMCIGFGIVLAAFGTRAAGTWRSWSVVGCGGMAIALFLLLQAVPSPPEPVTNFVRGNLHGTNDMTSVRIFAAQFLLVGRSNAADHFRFVAFSDDLKSPDFYLLLVDEKNPKLREAYIGCISTDLIKSRMSSSEWLNFSVEKDRQSEEYRFRDNSDGREYGEWNIPRCAQGGSSTRPKVSELFPAALDAIAGGMKWLLGGPAFAQSGASTADLLTALESESSDVRAAARDQLAKARDRSAYQTMTASWNVDRSSYRADLGRLVAWNSAIRQNREAAVPLSAALSPEQIAYLVRLTGHGDKTMRFNATEALSWLLQSTGWPSGTDPAKAKILTSETAKVFAGPEAVKIMKPGVEFDFANTAYNTLVALDDAKCVMYSDGRTFFADILPAFELKYGSELPKSASLSKGVRAGLAGKC